MESIFIQIASYRDAELKKTVSSALKQAKHPDRLTFGICWQYDEVTYTDLDTYLTENCFRIDQVYYRDSGGCCWARNRTNLLYRDEDFTLQIDAHTRFAPDWDVILVDMLRSIDASKPILSTYPAPYEVINGMDSLYMDRGIQKLKLERLRRDLTTKQTTFNVDDIERPGKSQVLAAGMIFTLGGVLPGSGV